MWMPGIDHASIAVHVLLEKDLKRRENKTRFELGREEFMRRAWAWKERSGNRISEQEKLMGFSLDWPRERFTMDEQVQPRGDRGVRAALRGGPDLPREADDQLGSGERDRGVGSRGRHRRGERLAVGDPLSDRRRGGGEIVVATTRPETMLGDTARRGARERRALQGTCVGKLVDAAAHRAQIPIVRSIVATASRGPIRRSAPAPSRSRRRTIRTTTRLARIASSTVLQVIDAKGRMLRARAGEVRRDDRRGGAQGGGRRPRGRAASSARSRTTRCRAAAASARAR